MHDPSHSLRSAGLIDNSLRQRLLEQFGEAIGDDDKCLTDTLDGISDLPAAVDLALQAMAEADQLAAAAKARATDLNRRASAASARSDRIRAALTWAMLDSGRQKIVVTEGTVSVKKGGQVVVIDGVEDLPAEYLRIIPPEPDKTAIKKALAAGVVIPGATLEVGPATIQIRR